MTERIRSTRPVPLQAALLIIAACGSDATLVGDETETGSESTSTSETSGSTESGESTEETGDDEPRCGDGTIDWFLGEECDDANDVDDDGCNIHCESACGLELAANLVLPDEEEWFAVDWMKPGPREAMTLAGHIVSPSMLGRVRVIAFQETQPGVPLSDEESGPLGPEGEIHEAVAVALNSNGSHIFVIGWSVVADVESHWLARFSAADLTQDWRVPLPGDDEDTRPRGLTVLEDDQPVVVQTEIIDDTDRDIAVRKLSAVDGSVDWTTHLSGEFDGGWSLDEGFHAAHGQGGHLWVTGLVRVNWETHDTTLFELTSEDGALVGSVVPIEDPGQNHRQRPVGLAAGYQGDAAVGLTIYGPASAYHYFGAFRYEGDELVAELKREDLPWEDGEPYIDPKVALDDEGRLLVSGTYLHEFQFSSASRVWTAKLEPDGSLRCAARIGQGTDGGVVPQNGFFGSGRAAINLDAYGPGGMGPGSGDNWLAGLRE